MPVDFQFRGSSACRRVCVGSRVEVLGSGGVGRVEGVGWGGVAVVAGVVCPELPAYDGAAGGVERVVCRAGVRRAGHCSWRFVVERSVAVVYREYVGGEVDGVLPVDFEFCGLAVFGSVRVGGCV